MQDLKESARVMVLNVSSLLKTVKAVEDEHTRGTRAMEATVEAISQEIKTIQSPLAPGTVPSTPEDLVRVTKNVTIATAKAVAAGTSNLQSDIVAAANIGRRAISEMLSVCRSVAWSCAETYDLRQRTLDAGASVAISYRDLLQGVLKGCSADERMHMSRRVAKCVTDLVAMAQLLKGSDWVDPEDPTVIAENELLGAAASIDAAAKKLANLRPRRQPDIKETDANLQFDEMILEAARGIMAASSALVRAANAAQRELIDQGKVSRTPLTSSDDGQWSEGLISAARLVAAATHSLVEAAQNLVQGVGTEEMLISSAKQVAASTAQLLIACKVKSDPNSETGRRLQAAGNAVIKSTDNLVRAAQQAIDMEEEHILKINTSMVDGMAQKINARSEVLKMEKQLEEARNKLVAIRQAKYRHKVSAGLTDESDGEGYQQYYQNQQGYQSSSPQHFHIANRSHNVTPPSPSFQNTSTSTTYQQSNQQTSPRQNRSQILTANSVPKPYQPSSDSSFQTIPQSPILNRSFNGNTSYQSNDNSTSQAYQPTQQLYGQVQKNPQLEACVQDLHEKTFGRTGVLPMSTFKTTSNTTTGGGHPRFQQNQNDGYTSRYETKTFSSSNADGKPISSINDGFSNMTISNDGNNLRITDTGSNRLASMTQRVMERQTVTTSSESKMEKKNQQHSYRLE